jgi:uncharacterized protein
MHVGAGAGSDGSTGTPAMVRDLARRLPGLDIVACHFGGYHRLDVAELLWDEDIYLDTSWPPRLGELDPDVVRNVILRHGTDRVLFASDWPTADPSAELATVRSYGLDAAALAQVTGGNAARLFGIDSAR